MKTFIALLTCLVVLEAQARLTQLWDFNKLNDKATLIVVATATNVVETAELTALPNIVTVYQDGRKEDVKVKGIETTFQILTVLKGDRSIKTLVLHHFKEINPEKFRRNSAGLVAFVSNDKKRFLMFLQKETDGRYIAVSGQTDPDDSIKELAQGYP